MSPRANSVSPRARSAVISAAGRCSWPGGGPGAQGFDFAARIPGGETAVAIGEAPVGEAVGSIVVLNIVFGASVGAAISGVGCGAASDGDRTGISGGDSAAGATLASGSAPQLVNDPSSGAFAKVSLAGAITEAAISSSAGWICTTAATTPTQAKQNTATAHSFSVAPLSRHIWVEGCIPSSGAMRLCRGCSLKLVTPRSSRGISGGIV